MEHANSIILSLQRTIGNQAVSSLAHGRVGSVVESRPAKATQSLIQRVRLNATDLLDLTVAAFDRHRQAEQADWSNESLTQTARGLIWDIIEWGPAGLGPILLKDIVNAVQSDGRNRVHLQNYCEALSGKLRGVVTTTVPRVGTLTEVLKTGKWIGELTSALTGPRLKATMPPDRFTELIADEAVATAFIDYYTKKSPVLQTPSGREYEAFVKLVKEEGAKIDDYVADLPTIRNLHKFEKESLDKLKLDKGQKDRPLTLVFVAMFDHNGAFIRHAHVNAVIQHKKLRAFAIEGVDAPAITSLTKTGLAQIAAAHGMDGKITQVMFAGHGNSVNMEAVGQGSDVVNTSGEYKVEPRGEKQLYFGVKSYDDFWTPFFDALFANMEMKGGLQPKILLRACLTASNHVDTDKLKKEMRAKNVIDVDDKSVDPTLPENQAKIRAAIDDYIKTYGSLQSVLTDRAKSRAEILGAQASITSASAGAVNKDTGELEIVPLSDPTVARSKIEYVRFGKEPLGALKAVIEAWARAGPDACFAKMDEREGPGRERERLHHRDALPRHPRELQE